MNTFRFITNINCNNCISAVTPFLNSSGIIKEWSVDITDPSKILTITGENLTAEYVKEIIKQAGYKAEEIE
jgi:copper chaperone CopZ